MRGIRPQSGEISRRVFKCRENRGRYHQPRCQSAGLTPCSGEKSLNQGFHAPTISGDGRLVSSMAVSFPRIVEVSAIRRSYGKKGGCSISARSPRANAYAERFVLTAPD